MSLEVPCLEPKPQRAMHGAQNAFHKFFISLEELTEEDLTRIKERYARVAEGTRSKSGFISLCAGLSKHR
jgi:hypothetical protein